MEATRQTGRTAQNRTGGWGCTCHSRRGVLAGLSALTASALAPAKAQVPLSSPGVQAVDTHHHIYPPRYTRENIDRIVNDIGVLPAAAYLNWSPSSALEKMDQAGVAVAVNSMSSPGVWFGEIEAGRARARECNEYGAKLMQDYPRRFGMFAALPLPDLDGSLRECAYAFDDLKLDGVGLLTSYEGRLLGDPAFAPVYEELDRREAAVFVHPTMSCCGNTIPGVTPPILEFPMDTARTIVSLVMSGTFARYPRIRFIFSHGGGTLLPVVNRLGAAVSRLPPEERATKVPDGVNGLLGRQHYDVASIALNPAGFEGLKKLIPSTRLLYGSDEPFNSTVQMARSLPTLNLSPEEVQRLRRDNAVRLFPRLQV